MTTPTEAHAAFALGKILGIVDHMLMFDNLSEELSISLNAVKAVCLEAYRRMPEGDTGAAVLVPVAVAEALRAWSGNEPSQSVLAREIDRWIAP